MEGDTRHPCDKWMHGMTRRRRRESARCLMRVTVGVLRLSLNTLRPAAWRSHTLLTLLRGILLRTTLTKRWGVVRPSTKQVQVCIRIVGVEIKHFRALLSSALFITFFTAFTTLYLTLHTSYLTPHTSHPIPVLQPQPLTTVCLGLQYTEEDDLKICPLAKRFPPWSNIHLASQAAASRPTQHHLPSHTLASSPHPWRAGAREPCHFVFPSRSLHFMKMHRLIM